MTEHVPESQVDQPSPKPVPTEPVPTEQARTGEASVDEVLESVAGLESLPVAEHVRVFEEAHDRLRRALDGRADPTA